MTGIFALWAATTVATRALGSCGEMIKALIPLWMRARLPETCFCAEAWLSWVSSFVNPYFFISCSMPWI